MGGLWGEVSYALIIDLVAPSPFNCLYTMQIGFLARERELSGEEEAGVAFLSITEATTAKAMPKFCFCFNGGDIKYNNQPQGEGAIQEVSCQLNCFFYIYIYISPHCCII